MTQLRAIEIRLRKCVPDLAAAEIKSEQTRRYVSKFHLYWTGMNGSGNNRHNPSLPTAEPTVIWTPGQQSGAVCIQ
jgi:hypothetical protein